MSFLPIKFSFFFWPNGEDLLFFILREKFYSLWYGGQIYKENFLFNIMAWSFNGT